MKHSNFSRFLSLVLVLVMVLSMLPAAVFASDSAVWTKVDAADITADDTIMVTMTNPHGVTYALYTVQSGSKGNEVRVVTVSGDTITTDGTADYGWTVTAVEGGYKLSVDAGYLYTIDNNNGVRIGATEAVWAIDGNYLSTTDTAGNTRWLGVYDNNNGDYSVTPNWRAYKNTTGNTKNQTLGFFKLNEGAVAPTDPTEPSEPVETEPVELPTYALSDTIAAGDVVLLYNAGSGTVVTSTFSGYKLSGAAVSASEGVISADVPTAEWTVGINEDGTYTFTQGELTLGMVQSGTYVNLSTSAADGNTAWAIEDSATENVHYLRNVNMPASSYGPYYLEYYSGYTAYASSNPSDGAYGFGFYVKGGTPVDPEPTIPTEPSEPDPTEPEAETASYLAEAPQDGDTVLIYNAANSAVLGSYYDGKRQAGVTASVENELITLTDEMAELLVTLEEEVYTFTLDGLYLTSADTGNGLFFQEELTDMGRWTLEQKDNGKFIIMNVGANYNGNHNQALEYYNGFTTYGVKETDIYMMDFYLVDRPSQGGKLTSADQFVSGTYVMVVEGGYAMGVLDGTWVSAVQPAIVGDVVTDAKGGIWTLTVNGSSVQITDSNGASIKPKGGNNNGIASGSYDWDWSFDEATGTFVFAGTGSDTVKLASNANEDPTYGGFHKFRGYKNTTISGNPATYPHNFTLYAVVDDVPETTLPAEGEQVVIYNLSAEGVLAAENDTQSIENALTAVENGVATPANGGVVFTVSKNGNYYRFYNETYGYLCSNGTGNNAFYSLEASEDADWTLLEGKSGGYNLESRTAKYNGTYSQYLEYYGDSYKTYSMYNVTDYDIYEFFFYPVAEGVNLSGGIVNQPTVVFSELYDAYVGQPYTFGFEVDAVFGVQTLTVKVGQTLLTAADNGKYTIPVELVTGESLTITVEGVDTTGAAFSGSATVKVIDEPSIIDVSPASNSQTGSDKRPVISAVIVNAGEDAIVTMTVGGETVEAVYENGIISWQSGTDMADGRTSVTVTVKRADGKTASKTWSFTVGEAQYELYFGQLHSHTTYSDGSGSLESALSYIGSLPESANVDFVAFTDHSNYFDTTSAANPEGALYDMSLAGASSQSLWNAYKGAVAEFNASQSDVVAIGGFEMTWSGGPGHINTFATPGIVSRNNSTLNNKTADAGMKAYYALLSQSEGVDGINQFNHPGTTFGNFTDFAYWDPVIDSRIQLVEVGNGEGQIGAGGYFPSYEQYTMALDKGWHLAPTNNQDNHKGKWGNANDARDVVLTADFTEEGIYEAIRNYRVYATEDKNLEIGYTVNGMLLGSILTEVPEQLNLAVTLYDPDVSDSISKVEVIVNSGKVAHTWDNPAELSSGMLTATLAPDYSYYYLRVTQGDGDIAVTAPVWVGETLKLGISNVVCGTSTPVTGEELTISTTLFNSETTEATVKSLTYSVGSQVLGVDNTGYTLPASGNFTVDYNYTPDTAKVMSITVTAVVELDGVEYTFSMDVKLDVQDASKLVYIGIDASHYNEYVAGNYKDSMGNFGALAAGYSVRTVELKTSEELIAACSNEKYTALILTAPSRRLAAAQEELLTYTADELAAIKAFNAAGGTVILAGWSDNYENYPQVAGMTAQQHMAATQNALLEALGSSLRITDDATHDDSLNGGQTQRLYFNAYNFDSFLMDGVEVDPENPNDRLYTEVYSQYGGATIHVVDANGNMTSAIPETVTPIVFGHTSTYSKDTDNDGIGGSSVPKYAYAEGDDRLMVLASEELPGQGLIVVAGAAFMSNFEVQATIEDSGSEKNYSNYKICENLVSYLNPVTVTDIADVQAETEEGVKFTIEGVVTSNASGYDKDTAFFDCIYLQDDTAGINAFPVAGNYKIGDKVRITGTTSSYQGERQIAVTEITLISEGNEVAPMEITASELNDGSKLGSLVTLKGTVESFEYANGLIQTIMVKDSDGNIGRIFIDGYITTGYDVENLKVGAYVVATGLASYDNSFDGPAPRIRIRDRHDVLVTVNPASFEDISEDGWYYDAVCAMVDNGLMVGKDATHFDPAGTLTRAEWVTMLYRAAGSPAVSELSSFTDVPADSWCAEAFAWAEDMGIVAGVAPGKVAPTMTITREQLVITLHRFAGSPYVKYDLSVYTDIDLVSYYAFDSFEWAVAKGYVTGMSATTLAPQVTTNRAQAATILAHYLGLI